MSVDSGRKFLQGQVDGRQSVFDHFAQIIDKVVQQKPNDPHGALEVLSRMLKDPSPAVERFEPAQLEASCASAAAALKVTELPKDESGEPKPICGIPNFMEEAEIYEWAGCGFGESESYQIMCSLRKLGAELDAEGCRKLRFWGKMLGTGADYYVAEGQMDAAGEADENDPDFEPAGTGANMFTYWVTTDLTAPTWTKLPNIYPKHIIAARNIKKMLTGDLKAKVITHPHFPGDEMVLLRAQIARITADTVLCIGGFIKANEDGEVEEDPEFVVPMPSELSKKEAWTHEKLHILRNGRTAHPEIPDEGEEGDEEAAKKRNQMIKEQENDPVRDRIRPIATDPDLKWTVKQFGDQAVYEQVINQAEGKIFKLKSFAVTAVYSLTWPGAVCACRGDQCTNLYIGHGLKFGEPDFFPGAPPDIQDEPEDPGEQNEPQPEGAPPGEEEPVAEEEAGG